MGVNDFESVCVSHGVDYENTMDRFMNNKEMYLRFVGKLAEDNSIYELGEALESGELSRAFSAAHNLKGVAGNMGLTKLFRLTGEIVEPLRREDKTVDYAPLYERIMTEFNKLPAFNEALGRALND